MNIVINSIFLAALIGLVAGIIFVSIGDVVTPDDMV